MIRKMDMSDVTYVYELEKKTFGKSLEKPMLTNEILYNDMAHYFILIEDGKRLGYAGMWVTDPNGEIINIAVEAPYRQKGYGKALMQTMIAHAKKLGVKHLTLEVSEKKEKTVQFYQSFGFYIETKRKNYYKDGTNALLMIKQLGGKA